jgi:microsomal epoxide hydrolase
MIGRRARVEPRPIELPSELTVMAPGVEPFTIDVGDAVLNDLSERLRRARLPSEPTAAGWHYGANLEFMRGLVTYWRDEYDWRPVERHFNRLPQYRATVGDLRIHLIYERGAGTRPLPLVITHGWPGSFVEFDAVVEPLTHPERFGGAVEDAFDVVVPSLPGFGWSEAPAEPMTTREIARLWDRLMTSVLGYDRYVAQGGDWGSLVASWLGVDAAKRVPAIHINLMGLRPHLGDGSAPLAPEEAAWVARAREQLRRETGYQAIQGTKPQTLAYALTDSPVGLAAWIVEKVHGWTEPTASKPPFQFEPLVTNVMVYWVTGCANTASWLYTAARQRGGMRLGRGEFVSVPTGFLSCPNDLFPPPPDAWVRRVYNCVRRTDLPMGGHFVAWEQPRAFVEDVRTFFRAYRGSA